MLPYLSLKLLRPTVAASPTTASPHHRSSTALKEPGTVQKPLLSR